VSSPLKAPADAPPTAGAPPRVLVVDDERSMREMLDILLRREGYAVVLAEDGTSALRLLQAQPFDMLISDIKMPDMSGVEVLRAAKSINEHIVGIMITAYGSKDSIQEVLRLGAADYLDKPFNVEELKFRVRKELERRELQQENVLLKRVLQDSNRFENIVGRSPAMQAVFQLIETIAPTSSTVLITGESGTGKELVARAIHFNSGRSERPFVALNCGALPETLLESELFGHVRGAFTGADRNKKGLLEIADKGSVLLDEIGEMSAMMQVKLLRVLQDHRFRPVGGTEEVEADIRIIAATNRDLAAMVEEGSFREDLFYRLNVIPVPLPPLREREGDIEVLAEHFVSRFSQQMGKPIHGLAPGAIRTLKAYHFPGNVRELENVIERAVAFEKGDRITSESLQLGAPAGTPKVPEHGFDLEQHVQEIERRYILEALRQAGGVQTRAAELLGMSFRSFRYYVKKYSLK
jgi:two-component system response regulator PilR (NtrC family)